MITFSLERRHQVHLLFPASPHSAQAFQSANEDRTPSELCFLLCLCTGCLFKKQKTPKKNFCFCNLTPCRRFLRSCHFLKLSRQLCYNQELNLFTPQQRNCRVSYVFTLRQKKEKKRKRVEIGLRGEAHIVSSPWWLTAV